MLNKVIWLVVLGIILAIVAFYLISLLLGAAYYFVPIIALIIVGMGIFSLMSYRKKPQKISVRAVKKQEKVAAKELKILEKKIDDVATPQKMRR